MSNTDKSQLDQDQHWTLREPISLSWVEQRELAIRRATIQGHVWCPFGHWFKRSDDEPHVHHIVKESRWVDPSYSHILPNLVAFCSQHHLPGAFPWHNERPHFLMRVFATQTGGEFGLLSRHRDQYMSWPRVRLAVLENDDFQCQCCDLSEQYINRQLYSDTLSSSIRYSGSSLRPYHFANPNEEPMVAHRTEEMVTLCFRCYWKDGSKEAPHGWRKKSYSEWKSYFGNR